MAAGMGGTPNLHAVGKSQASSYGYYHYACHAVPVELMAQTYVAMHNDQPGQAWLMPHRMRMLQRVAASLERAFMVVIVNVRVLNATLWRFSRNSRTTRSDDAEVAIGVHRVEVK